MKKIILPGLAAGVATLIIGMIVSYLFMLFPSVAADFKNAGVMRSWADPLMYLFFLTPFVSGVIYAWAWNMSKRLFKGSPAKRGACFGSSIWLISTVPGMVISYTSFSLSLLTIISWTLGGLLSNMTAGMIFAKMNK